MCTCYEGGTEFGGTGGGEMRSTFPEQIDQFVEHFDISPADIPHVKRYHYLKMQET